jgi:hypothetical protein
MDDHLKKSLQTLAADFSISRLDGFLSRTDKAEWSDAQRLEYLAARASGLSIAQAECAVRISEELRSRELEALLGCLASTPLQCRAPLKRRGKAMKEELDSKKQPKFKHN